MATDDRSRGDGFRPDLEGLRGIAVLLVVLFHAGVPGTAGGFVGVDVFFVLSGFLITGLLVREREGHGRIDLPAFYSRRARRILPAALVVAVVTLAFSFVFLAPLDLPRVAGDAAASALSAGNVRFAASSMDYFASGTPPSPYLHYWSLGVEEQFYVVWPALLILGMRGRRPRLGAGLAMIAVLVGSYVAAYLLTGIAAPWAFYSLPTRAWQLALGGLLAVTVTWHGRVPAWILAPIGWAGLAAILAAGVLIGPATPYPGVAALLPTIGAGAVVLGGDRRWSAGSVGSMGSVGSVLESAPLRFFGRISYSLYLVHWPILVLAGADLALGATLPAGERAVLVLASIAIATASYRWVEQPFRSPRVVALPARRTLAVAGVAIAATIVWAVGVDAAATRELGEYASEPASASGSLASGSADEAIGGPSTAMPIVDGDATAGDFGSPGGPAPVVLAASPPGALDGPAPGAAVDRATPSAAGTGAAAPGPGAASGAASAGPSGPPVPPLSTQSGAQGGSRRLPPDVRPALIDAAGDWDRLLRDGCTAQELTVQPPSCIYGDPKARVTVALVGDSHAEQWFPAVARIARARDWRVLPFTKFSCRFVDLPTYSRILQRPYTECDAWRQLVVQRLEQVKPDLVLVSVAGGLAPMASGDADPRRQGLALARLLARIPGRIAIVADTPASDFDVPSCLSRHIDDVSACATRRADAFGWHHLVLERAAAGASGASIVDLSSVICPSDPCPAVLDGMIVYRDGFHLTATFATAIAGDLLDALPSLPAAVPPAPTTSPTQPIGAPTPSEPAPTAGTPATSPAIEPSPTPIPTSGP